MYRRITILLLIAMYLSACSSLASRRMNRVPESHRPTEEEMKQGREEAAAEKEEEEKSDEDGESDEQDESDEDMAVDDSKPF